MNNNEINNNKMKNNEKTVKIGNGKIYSIKSPSTNKIYIGSTFQNYLSNRLSQHILSYNSYQKNNEKYISSFEILKFNDYYIELIKEYPQVTKAELFRLEGIHMIENKDICVNNRIAGRTHSEFYNDRGRDYQKKYNKDYRDTNRDHLSSDQKKYYIEKKEYIDERNKKYRELNMNKIKEKFICEDCGGSYSYINKTNHVRTLKHKNAIINKIQ